MKKIFVHKLGRLILPTVFCLGLFSANDSHSQTRLAGWDIPVSTLTTTSVLPMSLATGVTASSFTMGSGLNQPTASSSSSWRATSYSTLNAVDAAALAAANTGNDYWAFELSASSGYSVVVTGIGSGIWSISSAGPQRMSLIYSTTSNFSSFRTIATATIASGADFDFASSFTTALAAAPITIAGGTTGYFRLVGYGGTSTGGNGGLRGNLTAPDFSISGTVTNLNVPYTWTGGSGTWAQGVQANWQSGGSSVAWENGKDPSFPSGGTLAVDIAGVSGGVMSLSGTTPVTLTGGALTVIGMTAGSGSQLNLNGATATVSGNIDLTDASLNGGNLSLGGILTANISTGTNTLSTALGGSGSFYKSGVGELILSATNTLSGGTFVNTGTLRTSGNEVLPDSGTLQVSGGATFILGGNETVGALIASTNPASFINLQGNTLTSGGNNSSYTNGATITGTGGMVKNGTGLIYFNNAASTYLGGFVLNGGSVAFTSSGTTTGGVLVSSVFGTGNLTLNDGTTITSSSATSGRNVNNNIFMSGNVQFGNSAWGSTNVQMNANVTTNTNSGTGVVTTNTNYSALFTAATNANATTTLQGNTTINTINWVDWVQPINGNFRLTKSGTGLISLSNNYLLLRASNNITGVTVNSGILGYRNRNALGTGTLIMNGGTAVGQDGAINNSPLTLNDQIDRAIPNNIRLDGDVTFGPFGSNNSYFGGNIDLNGGTTRVITLVNATHLYGSITNGGQLVIQNGNPTVTRTFSMFASGNYTGGTVVGTNIALAVGADQALGSGNLIFTNTTGSGAAVLRASTISTNNVQVRTITNNIQLATGSVVTLDAINTVQDSIGTNVPVAVDMVLAGNISGAGSLIKSNNNTVTLRGANSYSGATTIVNGTLVAVTNNISSTITSNTIAITFSNVPANGTYAVLPGALTGTGAYTATYTNLGSKTATFSTNSPASVTVTSALLNQTISFSALTPVDFGSPNFQLLATATSGLPVTYTSSDSDVASISGDMVTIGKAGSATITATQPGNGTIYDSAASVSRILTVNKVSQAAVSGSLGSETISFGGTTTVTARGGSGTGAYEFRQNGGTGSVSFTGTGDTRTINTTTAGTAVIQVSRAGDGNYNASPWVSAGTLTVNPAGSTSDYSSLYGEGSEETLGVNGLKNLMNYALGGTGPDSSPVLPVLTSDASSLTLTANIRDGVTVVGQYAYSLDGPWLEKTLLPVQGATSAVPGTIVKSFTQEVDVNEPRMFLRLYLTK